MMDYLHDMTRNVNAVIGRMSRDRRSREHFNCFFFFESLCCKTCEHGNTKSTVRRPLFTAEAPTNNAAKGSLGKFACESVEDNCGAGFHICVSHILVCILS